MTDAGRGVSGARGDSPLVRLLLSAGGSGLPTELAASDETADPRPFRSASQVPRAGPGRALPRFPVSFLTTS